MLVNTFNGGMHTRSAPQMLALNEGVEYRNIDEAVGTLISVKDKLDSGLTSEQFSYYYDFGGRFVSFPVFTSFVPYNNDLLYCNKAGSGRIIGETAYPLGLPAPTSPGTASPTVTPATPAGITAAVATTATTGALPVRDYDYLIVNQSDKGWSKGLHVRVKTTGAVEVIAKDVVSGDAPTQVVQSSATLQTITFSAPVGILGSLGLEIFRLHNGAWRSIGRLVAPGSVLTDSIFAIPSGNKVATTADFPALAGKYTYLLTYFNSVTGVESGASPVTTELDLTAGGSVSFTGLPISSQADKKRLYRVGGLLTVYALVTTLDMATTSYVDTASDLAIDGRILEGASYLPAPENLSYIEYNAGMVFGCVGNTLRFTPVGRPDAWPASQSILFDGVLTGLAEVSNGLLVFTRTKTYLLTGTGPSTLSRQLVDPKQGCVDSASIQKLGGAALWISTDGICTSNGGPAQVISREKLGKLRAVPRSSAVYDDSYYCLLADGSTLVLSLAYGPVLKYLDLDITALTVGQDILYGWKEGRLYELFASEQDLEFQYLSPRFIEGRATESKAYKKVYFFAKGDIIVDIIIDDVVVLAGARLVSGQTTQVQPPQDEQRGNYIQFRITGKGELFEYEYEVERRDASA